MSNFNNLNAYSKTTPEANCNTYKSTKPQKSAVAFLNCDTKEDKIIRNLWFVFVLSVFVFLSALWYFRGEFFEGIHPLKHELLMAHF